MNKKIKKVFVFGFLVVLCSPVAAVIYSNEKALAYRCTSDYSAWVKADGETAKAAKRATLNSCIEGVILSTQSGSVGWCQNPSHLQAGGMSIGEKKTDCKYWYFSGYFNQRECSSSRDPSGNNKKTCEKGKGDRSLYKTEYERRNPESSSPTGGSSESTGGSGSETATPTAGPDPETSEDEPATPSRSLNQDKVSDDLNAGEIKLGEAERKKTGVLNGLFGTSGEDVVGGLLNMAYTLASIIAIIVIVASGIMIMTADGDQQKVATGRQAIVYSCIGLVIVGSAFIITGIITGIGTN